MAEAASRLSISATGQKTQLEGRVTLAVSEIEAVYLLPPLIRDIRQRWPGIELDVQVSHSVADLKRREADVALRSFRPTEPDLIARKLYDESVWLYGTADYLATLEHPERRQDINKVQIIGFETDHQLIDYLAPQGWTLRPENIRITTLSQSLQIQLVPQHLGLCFLPGRIGDALPDLQRAYEHLGAPLQLPLWLVSHRELRTNPRVRVVFDALAQGLAGATGEGGLE